MALKRRDVQRSVLEYAADTEKPLLKKLLASYNYDHAGRRISRSVQDPANSVSQVSTQYLYDGQQAIGEVRDGKLVASIVSGLGLDEAIARITTSGVGGSPEVKSYLTDALGSVIAQ